MALPADLPAVSIESGDVSVTTTATNLRDLLVTGGVTSPRGGVTFTHILIPAGSTIYYGGSTVTATAGAHRGIALAAPLTGALLWEVPQAVRDPALLYLVASGATTITVCRGLYS